MRYADVFGKEDVSMTLFASWTAQWSGFALGPWLVELTKSFNDVVGTTATDAFMDAAAGLWLVFVASEVAKTRHGRI